MDYIDFKDTHEVQGDKLLVTHVTIKRSISILLTQLLFLNFLAAILIIGVFIGVNRPDAGFLQNRAIDTGIFLFIFIFQIFLTVYAALQWVNEYYEVNPKMVLHKKGLFFRKEEKCMLENIAHVHLQQDFLGKILNYGTISLYDFRRVPYIDLYLIHNPLKYMNLFERIMPKADQEITSVAGK